MTSQPLLPVHEDPRELEYFPEGEDGVPWNVKDWRGLKAAFEIEEHEIEAWHKELVNPDSRPWRVVRRIFGVVPMMGDAVEDDDDEEWEWKSLAKHWAVDEKILRAELEAAVSYWKKLRVSNRIAAVGAGAPAPAAPSNPREQIAEERITELLETYRFTHVKGHDRAFVAKRLHEMRGLLEDKNRREAARQLIVMELNLSDSETSRALLKSRLEKLSHKSDDRDLDSKESGEIQKIQDSLTANEKAHRELAKAYFDAAEKLGSEEIEQGELRKAALGTASYFVETARQFYEDGTMALIDGVFAADELVWLTTPLTMRDPQYRPDIVAVINDAMKPYNLFDPNYKPLKVPREASRRMLRLSKLLAEEAEPVVIPEIDDDPASEDEEAAIEAAADPIPDPESAPITYAPPPEPSHEDDVMAM